MIFSIALKAISILSNRQLGLTHPTSLPIKCRKLPPCLGFLSRQQLADEIQCQYQVESFSLPCSTTHQIEARREAPVESRWRRGVIDLLVDIQYGGGRQAWLV